MAECLEDFCKMNDEELISWQKRNADLYGPQIKLIISLLTWRSAIELKEAIEEFNITSEKYSRKICLAYLGSCFFNSSYIDTYGSYGISQLRRRLNVHGLKISHPQV